MLACHVPVHLSTDEARTGLAASGYSYTRSKKLYLKSARDGSDLHNGHLLGRIRRMATESLAQRDSAATGRTRDEQRTRRRLTGVFAVLALAVVGLAAGTYRSYQVMQESNERLLLLQELRGVIIHSDEVLTSSAYMASATGDPRWEERYRKYEPLLQSAIEQARSLVAGSYDSAAAGATDAANVALGRMEAEALALMRAGRLEEAQLIFRSDTYDTLKRLYKEGMAEVADQLQATSAHVLQAARRASLMRVLLLASLLPLLGAVCFYALRTLRRSQRRYARAAAGLETFTQARAQFLDRMNHAIRTPLTAITGYTDLLFDSEPSTQQTAQLKVVRRNGQQLLAILSDLVDLSNLQAGNLTIEWDRCSPFEIVSEVALQRRRQALERGISLDVEYLGRIPASIETDPDRLHQILSTLVGNAIEFTESGGVRLVTRRCEADQGGGNLLKFEVIDTGLGMTSPQCRQIFEAFPERGTSTSRSGGGTGLGLAIAQALARMLGGDLGVRSTVGQGTGFALTIPVGALEDVELVESPPIAAIADEHAAAEAETFPGSLQGRVLVAEDTPDTRLWVRSVLWLAGLDVDTVEDGQAAFEQAMAALEREEPYDVILMDMQMPVLNGYDATARLREAGYAEPIVALTAHALEGERDACIRAGCNDYATKPIDREALVSKVGEYLRKPQT